MNQSRKRQRTLFKQQVDETEYVIKNGMRCVVPYIYKHETFCKQVGNLRVLECRDGSERKLSMCFQRNSVPTRLSTTKRRFATGEFV